MSWAHGRQVAFLAFQAFLAQVFTEKLQQQNSKKMFRLHMLKMARKSQYKKVSSYNFVS